jgi:EpsI family protein
VEAVLKNWYVRVLTIVLLAQATLFYSASHGDSRLLSQPLQNFPKTLPGWQMVSQGVVEQDTLDVLKADDVLSRFYVRPRQEDLSRMDRGQQEALIPTAEELFVAYFSTQQNGRAPHSPKNCLPGSGWQEVDAGEITIPIGGLNTGITINKYITTKGEHQSVVLYWYQSHGRVVANEFSAKFYLVADSIRLHRSDTALVRVVTPVLHDDLAGALGGATNFVQAVFPAVYNFLPK